MNTPNANKNHCRAYKTVIFASWSITIIMKYNFFILQCTSILHILTYLILIIYIIIKLNNNFTDDDCCIADHVPVGVFQKAD